MQNSTWMLIDKIIWAGTILDICALFYIFMACGIPWVSNRQHKKWYREEWKKSVLPHFFNHTHPRPAESLQDFEEGCKNRLFSEKEMGVTVDDLLGHALICQRNIVNKSKNILKQEEASLGLLRSDTQRPILEWEQITRSRFNAVESARNSLTIAKNSYDSLNEKWNRVTRNDPQLKMKFALS